MCVRLCAFVYVSECVCVCVCVCAYERVCFEKRELSLYVCLCRFGDGDQFRLDSAFYAAHRLPAQYSLFRVHCSIKALFRLC